MTRSDVVAALGGGVVGDLAGFCAATYQRGVRLVQIPTTLVAQVDSAYGGKTGVDLSEAKNYVGAYHQPQAVIADTGALATLPAAELSAGYAEVVKTALIAGGALWELVRGGAGWEGSDWSEVVTACARTKLRIVAQDERDDGVRQTLNLGHTVGHAIETVTGYASYRHGEAVALGLLAALRLSGNDELRAEVADLLHSRGLPTTLTDVDPDAVVMAPGRGTGSVRVARRSRTGPAGKPGGAARADRGRPRTGKLMTMPDIGNRIEVMHGVNLDQLGRRDPTHYGSLTLTELELAISEAAAGLGLRTRFFQTNHEGEFVEHLHGLDGLADGIVLNPGAWTHYSYAIRDALELTHLPAVEIHLSDVDAREPFRRESVLRDLCIARVSGQGPDGYTEALTRLREEMVP
jgi:3-dehydroquinate dehydratase type II